MEPERLITRQGYALAPPRGVKWLGAFYLVAGIAELIAIISLVQSSTEAGPIVSLLVGAGFYLVLGSGILRLRRWAYWLALVLHIAVALAVPLLLLGQLYTVALITLAVTIVICFYLRRPGVRAAFGV